MNDLRSQISDLRLKGKERRPKTKVQRPKRFTIMFQDLLFAIRMLLKNPGFTAVVVVTLALGIGANAALFSVVNSVLLKPLPFPQPEQLVTIDQSKANFERGAIPYPNFLDMQRENRTLSSMAISRNTSFTLLGRRSGTRQARMISADYFKVCDIKPALGRTLTQEDDHRGSELVALISERLWTRKFSSATDVIERALRNDKSYRVVGVIPNSLSFSASMMCLCRSVHGTLLRYRTVVRRWGYTGSDVLSKECLSIKPGRFHESNESARRSLSRNEQRQRRQTYSSQACPGRRRSIRSVFAAGSCGVRTFDRVREC